MTIQKADYSLADQATISQWVTTDLPAKIASYQLQIDGNPEAPGSGILAQQAIYQGIENIFAVTYTSFHTIMVDGFHAERRWLTGDYYTVIASESLIQSTAISPFNTALFPIGYTGQNPLQIPDLSGTSDDSLPDSEKEGLLEEKDELTPPPAVPSPAVLLAAREKQRDALNNQIAALIVLSNNLDVGDSGQANLAFAILSANYALTRVLNLIATPSFYTVPQRLQQINDRLNGGATFNILEPVIGVDQRAAQIVADDNPHVALRYFWIGKRLNLAFGSLIRLRGMDASLAMIQSAIANLQAELAFYISIGFP